MQSALLALHSVYLVASPSTAHSVTQSWDCNDALDSTVGSASENTIHMVHIKQGGLGSTEKQCGAPFEGCEPSFVE